MSWRLLRTWNVVNLTPILNAPDLNHRCGFDTEVFDGCPACQQVRKRRPRTALTVRGQRRHRRTVVLDIPCRVASQQSHTPFFQAFGAYANPPRFCNHHRTPEPCLENLGGLGAGPQVLAWMCPQILRKTQFFLRVSPLRLGGRY